LAELVDTIGEQPVDDLVVGIKPIVLGDWFWKWNLVFNI
jgi:hypothetical protein